MRKYKGYYIDGIIFKSKEEIDAFHRDSALESYKTAVKLFSDRPIMERSIYAHECAERLVKYHGFTWEEIEQIEIAVYKGIEA